MKFEHGTSVKCKESVWECCRACFFGDPKLEKNPQHFHFDACMEAHKCRRTCFLAVTLIAVLQLAISSDAVAGLWRCNQSLSREVQPDHNTDNIMTVNTLNYNFSVDTERNITSDISKAAVPLQSNRTTNEVKIELENANVATSLTVEEQLLKKCSNLVPEFVFPTALDDPKFHQFQCKTVVVSVVLGDYDSFPFSIPKNSDVSIYGICWFVFMDWRSAVLVPEERRVSAVDLCPSCNVTMTKVNAWNVVFIPDAMMPLKSIGRNSRLFKMLIHRAFTHAEFLVYVDANMNLNPLSEKLISRYGRKTIQHRKDACILGEGEATLERCARCLGFTKTSRTLHSIPRRPFYMPEKTHWQQWCGTDACLLQRWFSSSSQTLPWTFRGKLSCQKSEKS